MDALPNQETFRELCLKCRRARASCVCGHLTPRATDPRVVLLQHPREARNPIGTARMAHLQLSNSLLVEGIEFHQGRRFDEIQPLLANAALLFPSKDAKPVDTLTEWPANLFVIDGTWSQARKLFKLNPWLHDLPQVRLQPPKPGEYQIRKEPTLDSLSTIEAIGYVLAARGAYDYEEWLKPFRALIRTQVHFAETSNNRRHLRERVKKKLRLPDELLHDERTVLVHAETNGWARTQRESHPLELMHWVAERRATGERFDVVVQPTLGWSPTSKNQQLSDADLAGAVPFSEFVQRWNAFTRDDDVYVSWGRMPTMICERARVAHAPIFDLQHALKYHLGKRLGRPEDATIKLQLPPRAAVLRGRAGRRLSVIHEALGYARTLV